MKSLRSQLVLRLLLGGAVLLGAAGVALDWQMRHSLTSEFDTTLSMSVRSLTALAEQEDGEVRLQFTSEDLPQFDRVRGPEAYLLRTTKGEEIERSASLGEETFPLIAGQAGSPSFFDAHLKDGRVFRCAGLVFVAHEEADEGKKKKKKHIPQRTEAVLVVGRDREPLDRTLATLRACLLLVGAGALGALAGIVHWNVKSALVPLDDLGERVAGVNAASLATRFEVEPLPTELRPVATRLNDLLARLESSFARERRFTATAAHELRTPLAELRALAEVNLTIPATDAERSESWRDALASTRRMESLAFTLLELARAEDTALAVHPETVNLALTFEAAWKPWAQRATERGINRALDVPADLTVETDPDLLGVILANLCGNAVSHAPAGSTFRVSGDRTRDEVLLRFSNGAGDLTEADLPHIFERFWRKDASRTAATHHGLGLSLASEFAQLLGGSLAARLLPSGELEVSLRLPDHPPE